MMYNADNNPAGREWLRRYGGLVVMMVCVACSDSGTNTSVDGQDPPPPITEDPQSISDAVTSITGRALNYRTAAPVADVVVATLPSSSERRTNAEGEYLLSQNVTDDDVYRITANHPDYAPTATFVITAAGRNRNVDMALVPLSDALGLAPEPPAVLFGDAQHDVRGLLRNTTDAPITWSVNSSGAPWVTLEPSSGTVAPKDVVRIAARLVPEAFREAVDQLEPGVRLLRGRLDIEGASGKVTVLHVVAEPADDALIALQWSNQTAVEALTVEVGASVNLDVLASLGARPLVGVALDTRVVHDNTTWELQRRTSTGIDGQAQLAVVARAGGVATVQVGLPAFPNVPVLEVPITIEDPDRRVSGELSQARAVPSELLADGITPSQVEIAIVDQGNRPFGQRPVSIAVEGDGVILPEGNTGTTDARGTLTLPVAASVPGVKQVTITAESPGGEPVVLAVQPSITFTVDPVRSVSPELSSVVVEPAQLPADGLSETQIQVTVRDTEGEPFAAQMVAVSLAGEGVVVGDEVLSDAAGQATIWATSTVAEAKAVTVTVNPQGAMPVTLDEAPMVVFTPQMMGEEVSAVRSFVTLIPETPIEADGVSEVAIQVTVLGPDGDPVVNQPISVAVSGSGNSVGGETVTNASGVAVATLASTVAEIKTITVTVGPERPEPVVLSPVEATFIEPLSTFEVTLTTVPMGPLRADGLEAYTVTAQVERPDSGAVVSGLEVSITLADGPGPLLIGDPAMTNQQGQASIDLRSNTPGSFVVSVQLEDSASRTRVLEEQPQITFRSPAPDVTLNSTFMASRTDGIVANGSDATQLTVTVRAPDNQPVADVPVRLEVSGGSNLLTPNAGTTDPAGVYTADLTSTVAELKQAQAILWPDSPDEVTLTPLELRFVGDPNAIDQLNSTIVASPPGPLVADGIEAYTLEVTVVDQRGNPVNGLFVQFESTVDGDLLTQPSDPTDGEGVATGEVRAVEPGSRDLSAMVLDAEMNTLAVLPAVPLLFRAIPGQPDPAQTVVAAVPDQIIANGQEASLVTVTVRDGNGDPVNGQEVELNTAGVDVVLEPIETVTDLQGQWTARLRGEQEGTVTVSAVIDPDGEALAVVDTATVELLTDPERVDPGRSSVVLTPDRVFDADGVDTAVLVVTLLNAAGEPIVGRTVSGGASPDVGVGFGAAAPTDGAGQTTVTLTSTEVGTVTVVVTDTVYAIALDDTPEVSFREPPRPDAINSELTPSRQRAEADGVDTVTLAVMALDQYGEPLDGLPVSWEVVEVSTGVGVPRPVPDDTTDAGSAEVTLTSATPGLLEVVVTLGTGPEAVVLGPIEVLFEPVSLPPQITLETATAVEGCAPLGYTLAQQDGEPVWVEVNWRDTSTANPPVSARQARDIGRAHVGVSGLAAGAAPTAYSFVWDSLRDVGRRDLEIDVLARARTATSDWSPISVQTFQVNNGLRFTDVNRPPSNSGRIQDVAVGDFSGDGYDEVVVTSPDFRITYVLNNVAAFGGQSVYGSGPQLNMLSGSVATVVGDADGDGDLDLIEVASFIGNTQLRVLVNEGSNVWSQGPLLDLGPGQAVDLVAGNLDDDLGDEVVVTFTDRMAQVSDPLDIGAAVESNPTAGEPGHLELVDMDHDGLLDVVTTQGGQVMLARVEPEEDPMGMGGPMPVEIREVALMLGGGPVDRLHTGDFNGDGLRDLLTWDAATEEATLHLQDASGGTWSLGETIDIGPVGDMVAANFDHAGGTDLAIFDDTTERIETWLQMDGTLVYSGSTPVTENVPTVPRLEVARIDASGALDLILYDATSVFVDFAPYVAQPAPQCGAGFEVPFVADRSRLETTGPSTSADLDGDGRPDLVVVDAATGALRTWFGWGDGTLSEEPVTAPALGGGVTQVVAAQLDADPGIDLAVLQGDTLVALLAQGTSNVYTSHAPTTVLDEAVGLEVLDRRGPGTDRVVVVGGGQGQPEVQAWSSMGDGTWAALSSLPLPAEPLSFAQGQLTLDFEPDLAVHTAAGSVLLLEGDVDGTFTDLEVGFSHADGTADVAVGDHNGDGADDVALLGTTGAVDLYMNDGLGGFDGSVAVPGASAGATALEFVDRDGDGRAELLVWREGLVEVLEGGAEPSPLPAGAVSVVGDLDGDGRRDLVVAGDDVAVVLQEEDGGYAVGERITISASSQPSRAVAVVDVNRDGFLDLLTALSGEAGLLLSQGGFGGLDPVGHVLPLPSEATALDVGLLDPARNRDLVVTCPGAGEVVVWDDVASSPQTSTPAQRLLVAELVEARLVNADEDAVPELAILSGGAATAQVAILDNDGTSPFGMSLATIALPAASQPPTDLRVADLDGDGVTELLVAMRPLSLVRVLKRDTGGVWSHVDDFEQAGATLEAFALGDWNANGRRELVVALVDTMGSPTLDVWSWDGMLFSREGVSMPLLQPPDELLLDDMNIDGRLDALLLNRTSSQVALGVQTAGGLALSSWALAGGTAAATTVDWSGDGWPDLVSVGDAQTLGVQQLR